MSVNLFFANVERTVASITARDPSAEVVDLDFSRDMDEGQSEEEVSAADRLTAKIRKWWKDTNQYQLLAETTRNMEIYGPTFEKAIWNIQKGEPGIVVVDPFAIFPAPGYTRVEDCPYICHAYPEPVDGVEALFSVKGVRAEGDWNLLGEERENLRPTVSGIQAPAVNYQGGFTPASGSWGQIDSIREKRALVVEVWLKDNTMEQVQQPEQFDPETGLPMPTTFVERKKYPGGIRVITVTNSGQVLLHDGPNPYVNPAFPRDVAQNSWLYDRFPFWGANSYKDSTSIWGFSAAEVTGDLIFQIDEIISRIATYLNRMISPPLILPQGSGITKEMINTKPNLVLMPTNPMMSQYIRFMPLPNLPTDFYEGISLFLSLFDRVYQIENADRGLAPKGVVAASAIVALQERNAVLIGHKIKSVDALVENRGRAAVSLMQNFAYSEEPVAVEDKTVGFRGTDYIGRRFSFEVESGSTTPRTTLQIQEQAAQLYKLRAIDARALLETLNFPKWRQIIERMGEDQLDMALNVLIQAGLPQQDAMTLKQLLLQPQGGPGDAGGQNGTGSQEKERKAIPTGRGTTPGTPRAMQGERPQ